MFSHEEIKKRVAEYAADYVEAGMTIGIGTGSTVYWLLQELGKRVQQGLHFKAVPTSRQTQTLATELGISLVDLNNVDQLVLTLDGADEVAPGLQLIKGGGGALLQEKIVAAASRQLIILADESKMVNVLGRFPLPVEVIPFGWKQVQKKIIQQLGCQLVELREKNGETFVSDHGHYILDCHFSQITDTPELNEAIHNIPGVVETGLFPNMADIAVVGYADGRITTTTSTLP
ncbi:ribose-5-phosphate isomerase [Filimonas lacunae]|uniref:Ribose-5-phosphate isomerase A n=1 Tax=Filimonas lacunae TaxID=477680 RepID=A0A173MQP7_9BACT|nr:ribose-5-phosphate isomerase RpiA [Filimonas lacunae]BAV09769.1 ribose 5-phosphate isomerase A [Filimonas lacunae]SIS78734.1 ribose-5-phosphate isomerase [Filimonas lacunae]